MPDRDPDKRYERQVKLRKERKAKGLCLQCGTPTLLNPRTKRPFILCGQETNNCRGANNASSNRGYHKKKES